MFYSPLALVLLVPLFFQFAFAQQQCPSDCTRCYTVQQGDICDSVSAANNVSTYQLATVNAGIIDPSCDNLTPGECLCLGTQGEDCNDTYVVQAYDTCDSIMSTYGLNGTIFWSNNPQVDSECYNLYIGEVVCVASTVEAPAPNGTIPAPIPSGSPPSIPWCD